jgi:hypothetical protein
MKAPTPEHLEWLARHEMCAKEATARRERLNRGTQHNAQHEAHVYSEADSPSLPDLDSWDDLS